MERQVVLFPLRGGYCPVNPFAGNAVASALQASINAKTAASAGAEDRTEHAGRAMGRTAVRFRQRKALAVVTDRNGPLQRCFERGCEEAAVQCRHVGAKLSAAGA